MAAGHVAKFIFIHPARNPATIESQNNKCMLTPELLQAPMIGILFVLIFYAPNLLVKKRMRFNMPIQILSD
jgi:hypothetical protein